MSRNATDAAVDAVVDKIDAVAKANPPDASGFTSVIVDFDVAGKRGGGVKVQTLEDHLATRDGGNADG